MAARDSSTDDEQMLGYEPVSKNPPPESPPVPANREKPVRRERKPKPPPCNSENCCLHGSRELRRSEEVLEEETDNPYANMNMLEAAKKEESYIRKKQKSPTEPSLRKSPNKSNKSEKPQSTRHTPKERPSSRKSSTSVTSLSASAESVSSVKQSTVSINEKKTMHVNINDRDLGGIFLGVQRARDAESRVKRNEFRLYYRLSGLGMQVRIPLFIAYKSSQGEVYHFPVVSGRIEDGSLMWHVESGDPNPPSFDSLAALCKYHRIYSYFDPHSGRVDAFPVWKNVDIPASS